MVTLEPTIAPIAAEHRMKQNLSPLEFRVGRQELQHGVREGAFAASRFPQDSENLAGANFQVEIVQGTNDISLRRRVCNT